MSLLKEYKNSVRISKDDIRELIHKGLPWGDRSELFVLTVETELIKAAIKHNKSIIIDDTNLNPHHVARYNHIAKKHGYTFKSIKITSPISHCIKRDHDSKFKVGRDLILNTAFRYGFAQQESEFVIYDLDGTLTDCRYRHSFSTEANGEIDYDLLYDESLMMADTLNLSISELLKEDFDCGYEIIIWSERPEFTRQATEAWLIQYGIPWNRLILRENEDISSEIDFKKSILFRYTDPKFCFRIIDDNPEILHELETMGINTYDVSQGVAI